MAVVRLLLAVEPRSSISAVRIDDVLVDIRGSGGEVETANDRDQGAFIAIATWSDWRGLAEWWTSARAMADAAALTVRGLVLDSPTTAHGRDLLFGEFSTTDGSSEPPVPDTARTAGSCR